MREVRLDEGLEGAVVVREARVCHEPLLDGHGAGRMLRSWRARPLRRRRLPNRGWLAEPECGACGGGRRGGGACSEELAAGAHLLGGRIGRKPFLGRIEDHRYGTGARYDLLKQTNDAAARRAADGRRRLRGRWPWGGALGFLTGAGGAV